jgi:hypothetical protein
MSFAKKLLIALGLVAVAFSGTVAATCSSGSQSVTFVDYQGNQPTQTFCCSQDSTLLDCGESNSLTMDYSSRDGSTTAEAGKVLSGAVVYDSSAGILDSTQIAAGFFTTDRTTPSSGPASILYNAEGLLF